MLSVVIPAYNEAKRLPATLTQIKMYLRLQQIDYELVVVDDGSRDDTVRVVQTFDPTIHLIRLQPNRGKGYAVRRGMLAAKGQRILFTDADLSTPISELDALAAALDEGADVAIGSRAVDRGLILVHQPWYREFMGRVFNLCVQSLAVTGIRDTQCGFKLMTRQAVHDVLGRAELDRFAFDVELVALAKLLGYRVAEVPVHWLNSVDSRVSILRDPLQMYFDLWRIRAKIKRLSKVLGRKW